MFEYKIGLDIGSTTVKLAVLNNENSLIYSKYKRHFSSVAHKNLENEVEFHNDIILSEFIEYAKI